MREIADELKISVGRVFTIMHEYLSMKKLCSKWVPCLLTDDQKQQHIDNSEHCLQLFQYIKKKFFWKYVTMDETWIHHFISKSNWQSAKWTAAGESCWKLSKDENISRQGFGLCILGCTRYFVHWLPWEKKNDQQQISYSIIGMFEGRNCLKMATNEKKGLFTKTMHRVTSLSQQWEN